MKWQLGHGRWLDLSRPRVMAIINVTPDSFADGGRHVGVENAVAAARSAVEAGAAILDIGGESTRPRAAVVSEDEQIRRVVPVIAACRASGGVLAGVPISVDTTRAAVAAAAIEAGADAVNDVSGGTDDGGMIRLIAERGCGVVIMHRLVVPKADVYSDGYAVEPGYDGGVARVVNGWLRAQRGRFMEAGVDPSSIVLDPGLGFGKSVNQNLELIARTRELSATGPVLSGLSRKSFVGRVSLGRDSGPDERLAGTLGLSVMHLAAGARVFRVHDVREHVEALAGAFAAMA